MKMEEKSKRKNLKQKIFYLLLNICLFFIAIIFIYVFIIFIRLPKLDDILKETRKPLVVFLDKDGKEIRKNNQTQGLPVSINTLPSYVWQAVISIEDKRFFKHGAFDIKAIFRALISNIIKGRLASGGSSITQQTAKNIFLSRDKKISRKIQEIIISNWLETRFNKKEILDLYLNRVSLVSNMRGINVASQYFFNKDARKLTIAESAQIAAMLKAPTTYSPFKNPDKNIKRAKIVLKEMVKQGYISLSDAQKASKELKKPKPKISKNLYRYWTDFVLDEVKSRIGNINQDIKIWTTIDSKYQETNSKIVSKMVKNYQGALISIEKDGAIRSMVGGVNYQKSQFNRTLALRQPGSTFKPIVYLVAFENGLTPDSVLLDSPFSIGNYKPNNYNNIYYGNITLNKAFAKSVNSIPLKLAQKYGIDEILNMASKLGVNSGLRKEYSTILGASEMTLIDLTVLYSVIWNNGMSVNPYSIDKITDFNDKEIYKRNPSIPIQLISLQTSKFIQILLEEGIKKGGTGHKAFSNKIKGGKTGTSNENRDAWFIGFANDLITGIWVGNDDFSPMNKKITGGTIPAEIFKESALSYYD